MRRVRTWCRGNPYQHLPVRGQNATEEWCLFLHFKYLPSALHVPRLDFSIGHCHRNSAIGRERCTRIGQLSLIDRLSTGRVEANHGVAADADESSSVESERHWCVEWQA